MNKIKKLLTLEDLASFCKEQNFFNFSSKDTGYQLSVQIPTTFEVEDNEYQDNTLLFCNVKLFHIGANRNNSSVTEDAAKKALPTIAYKPLLANFCEIDGVKDFTSHDMNIDSEGNIQYIEHQIGCFTADSPVIKYDEETEKKFVYARVAIPRDYTDACDIIERKDGTKVSVELLINEMQYSCKDNILELTDVIVQGATCLGKDPETGENVEEGMKGARLDIEDFSNKNNSIMNCFNSKVNEKLIEILERLEGKLDNLSKFNDIKDSSKEGGNKMGKFNELLEQYGLSEEDIDFEYDGLSDEELENLFAEKFGGSDGADAGADAGSDGGDDGSDEGSDDTKYALTYELSHNDIKCGIYNLLSASLAENTYAWVAEVYDNYFIYEECNYETGSYKYVKQSYSVDGDDIAFSGDSVEVFPEFVTESEKNALAALRLEYSELKAFKENIEKQELQAKKDEILNNEKYSVLSGNEKFEQLKKDTEKFSVEDIEKEVKLIFADFVMETGNYSTPTDNTDNKPSKIGFNFNDKPNKVQAYAGLFDEE